MPFPLIPLLITAAGAAASYFTHKNTNKKREEHNQAERDWQTAQYDKERADALADWDKQNAYNSPDAQMLRLRQAGLNPNMVYDNGATHTASSINQAKTGSPNMEAPTGWELDLGGHIMQGQDAQISRELADAQVQLSAAQKLGVEAKTLDVLSDTDKTKQDIQITEENKDLVQEQLKENIEATKAGTDLKISQKQTDDYMREVNKKKALQDLANSTTDGEIKATINKFLKEEKDIDLKLKQMELELYEMGISKHDPMWLKMLLKMLDNPREFLRKVYDNTK